MKDREVLKEEIRASEETIIQLQAEIERLNNTIEDMCDREITLVERSEKYAKSEAIEEFAERLKFIMYPNVKLEYADIDDLVKELTEKNDKG